MARDRKDQVFNDRPGKHYRRTYSVREVGAGAVVVVLLAGVAGWVGWKGAHPEEALFAAAPSQVRRGPESVDRAPLPADLAPPGWAERSLSRFGPDNVYEKINGREGFYKSFGFEALTFVSFLDPDDETRGVDVEVYDLGEPANAMSCLSAEAGADRPPVMSEGGLLRTESNARFLTRGHYYLRLVASDDSEPSVAALDHLHARLVANIDAGELPWAFSLFVGELGVSPAAVSYHDSDAFSLAAGKQVHSGELDDDGTAVFVSVAGSQAEARASALRDGFAQLGELRADGAGRPWVEDRYLNRVSTAVVDGPFVAGVYSAANLDAGSATLDRLLAALGTIGEEQRVAMAGAVAAAADSDPSEEYQ